MYLRMAPPVGGRRRPERRRPDGYVYVENAWPANICPMPVVTTPPMPGLPALSSSKKYGMMIGVCCEQQRLDLACDRALLR